MKTQNAIVTVGLCPTWDVICRADNLRWNTHRILQSQTIRPAGKALNISRALAWMKTSSVAAGLWGQKDYAEMEEALAGQRKWIALKCTAVPGKTRQNITLLDTGNQREIHLRAQSELATPAALKKLRGDLDRLVQPGDFCAFAGSLPPPVLMRHILPLIQSCRNARARVILDSSGPALRTILQEGGLFLIKPNVEELSELVGEKIPNRVGPLLRAGKTLLPLADMILISRGSQGVLLLSRDFALQARCTHPPRTVISTVGCGDYLLAGFLKGLAEHRAIPDALSPGLQAAAAHAAGLTESRSWRQMQKRFPVNVREM